MLRSGRHWEEDLSVWTASDVILREGYPLEQHSVTTPDGYVLQVQRIPRHGARDVVFFQHGVLDTSLGWVSNGVVGSAAFAAYDAGFDVWLGNSRSNAPRLHVDADRQGSRYWLYSINELGVYDIGAVVTHIHNTKMAELAMPGRHSAAAQEAPAQQAGQLRRSASDSQLGALRWVDVHSGSSRGDLEPASSSGLGGEQGWHGASGAPAAVGGHGGSAATSSSQQQEGWTGGGQQEEQPWWQRLASGLGVAQQQESAMAPVAGCAAPLRRVQSAPELALGQEGGAQYAVPVRMRQRQPQRQQQRGSGRNAKSSSSKAQGSKRGDTAGAAAGGSSAAAGGPHEVLPYRLQAVAHSLGAAAVMMYAVVCRMRGQPHRLRRLVLMSPAGFHSPIPGGMLPFKYLFPPLVWLVDRIPLLRGHGLGMRLPSPLLRYITFKFSKDLRHMPALQDLVAAFMRAMTGGDTSQWQAALQLPHYSAFAMPALSMHCGAHFAQWALDPSFRLFDYGSKAANRRHYGTDRPPSLAEHYRLLDIPVDVLAGGRDGVIPPAAVLHHVRHLRTAGVPCSFRILPYGHMDLVMAVKDDIRMYVLSKLRNPLP
ncbi:hypothetical protein COHA_004465 [Chlorella ohadii]|uniref:Partial AB-hydrolase lipase domain-containing protein n=1 Tax=Chlorella ohadii TaxID=2649997 RepID=A0AAD5H5S8_9CHLO|nr:hypothetical protein COHA_004465 [Chlorella ohadii]